jgi:hypothetical protein
MIISEAIEKWARFNITNKGELLARLVANNDEKEKNEIVFDVSVIYDEIKKGYFRHVVNKPAEYGKKFRVLREWYGKPDGKRYTCDFIFKRFSKPGTENQYEPLILDISARDPNPDYEDVLLAAKNRKLVLKNMECPECDKKECTVTIEEGKAPNRKKKASLKTHCNSCGLTISEQDIRNCMEKKHLQDDHFSDLIKRSKGTQG